MHSTMDNTTLLANIYLPPLVASLVFGLRWAVTSIVVSVWRRRSRRESAPRAAASPRQQGGSSRWVTRFLGLLIGSGASTIVTTIASIISVACSIGILLR